MSACLCRHYRRSRSGRRGSSSLLRRILIASNFPVRDEVAKLAVAIVYVSIVASICRDLSTTRLSRNTKERTVCFLEMLELRDIYTHDRETCGELKQQFASSDNLLEMHVLHPGEVLAALLYWVRPLHLVGLDGMAGGGWAGKRLGRRTTAPITVSCQANGESERKKFSSNDTCYIQCVLSKIENEDLVRPMNVWRRMLHVWVVVGS